MKSFDWATPTDAQDELETFRAEKPKKGTGGVLRLVPLKGKAPAPTKAPELPQSNGSTYSFKNAWAIHTVIGRNVADLAAIGATARGKTKKTVTVKVGAKNFGPAFVFGVNKPAAKIIVNRPAGTTVVGVPTGCLPSAKGKVTPKKDPRGAAQYLCTTTMNPFEVGKNLTWAFKLMIIKKGCSSPGFDGELVSWFSGVR